MTFSKEPTIWLGVIRAGLYLAAHFGLTLSAEQTAAIVLFCEAVTVLINRQVVTPASKPPAPPQDPPKDDPPATPRSGGPLLAACLALVACSGSPKPVGPECGPDALSKIEAAYIAEAVEACGDATYDDCEELPEIRAKWQEAREEWKRCGQ